MKKNRTKLLFMLFLSMGLANVSAQQALVATGGNSSSSGGSLSYSVGQIVYTSSSGASGSVNQGVQQPYEFFNVGLDENPGVSLQLMVYPNPTISKVTLNTGNLAINDMVFQLFDENGRLLQSQRIENSLSEIPLQNLPVATYLLKILDRKSEIHTFKIIKK